MKAVKLLLFTVALLMAFSACGGKSKPKVALEEAKGPGRDAELFGLGAKAINKGSYDEGRMLLNTMINTYTDSPLIKIAKLAIADSFYLEGGTKAWAQADVEYNDWLQFFPNDELSDDVMLKRAEIYLKQVKAPDREITDARKAERILKELLRRYPNTDKKETVENRMNEVEEILAMHELKVARFYFELREAPSAAQMRTEEILNKYPQFSRFDEALWLHARAMEMQEDTETASQNLARIIASYPHSEYREKAAEKLKSWGKEVPEVDPEKANEPAPDSKSMPARIVGFLMGPHIDTSNKGVIVDRDQKPEEIVARAKELAGAKATGPVTPGAETSTNSKDARPRRAVQAGQDVEVKPGASGDQKQGASSSKDKKSKDKKKKDDKKKDSDQNSDGASKLLRNP
jgi:outer membrane protein assembly factor BamD